MNSISPYDLTNKSNQNGVGAFFCRGVGARLLMLFVETTQDEFGEHKKLKDLLRPKKH
jgi:hypothetical protein